MERQIRNIKRFTFGISSFECQENGINNWTRISKDFIDIKLHIHSVQEYLNLLKSPMIEGLREIESYLSSTQNYKFELQV